MIPKKDKSRSVAVLCSGGLDSAVLLAWCAERWRSVTPLFIRSGLSWEPSERRALTAFLKKARLTRLRPVSALFLENRDLFEGLWMMKGRNGVPDEHAPWDSVEIPGRNLFLMSKAAVYCVTHGIDDVALGILRDNPFPDARPAFFKSLENTVALGTGKRVRLLTPFRDLDKHEVIRLGTGLPLGSTLSCIDPRGTLHCGRCTKCFERRQGYRKAGIADPTRYRFQGSR